MKAFIHLVIGIALRVLIYFSNYQKLLSQLIIFDNAPYSFNSLRENYFYTLFKSTTSQLLNSENVFIVRISNLINLPVNSSCKAIQQS